ncbi:MAG TPA: hypothetical protein VFO03_03865 [Gaiellaceae bacterium]|nr:hypothetical protein [Gaiellaceae bacterium]
MEMNAMVDRGKLGADRVVETLQGLPPKARLGRRRKSRADRVLETIQGLPPAARVVLIAAATGAVLGVAFLARKRLFATAAVVADVVEEAADTVEDAAEDLAEAARERSEGTAGD